MNPITLGLFVSLACRVHCNMNAFQGAASSAYRPSELSAGGIPNIEWAPGIKEYYQNMNDRQTLRLRFNKEADRFSPDHDQPYEARRKLNDHEIRQMMENLEDFKTTTTIAPSQQAMSRTVYTREDIHKIAERVYHLRRGTNYRYDPATEDYHEHRKAWDVTGCFGKIKVYDSTYPDQLVYETCCCFLGDCKLRHRLHVNAGQSCVYAAVLVPCGLLTCWCAAKGDVERRGSTTWIFCGDGDC